MKSDTQPTRLIIVRHAETEANVRQVWQGSLDAPLTARGRAQTTATAARIADLAQAYPIDHFFVSPLPRAQSTAATIAQQLGKQPAIRDDLREFHLGVWEGRSFQDLRDNEQLWERWAVDPAFAPPEGESPMSFGNRAEQAFLALANDYPGSTVLAVSHGGLICNVLARWLGNGPQDWRNWEPHNCAVTILEQSGDAWRPILVNDISHLPPDARFDEDKSVYTVDT